MKGNLRVQKPVCRNESGGDRRDGVRAAWGRGEQEMRLRGEHGLVGEDLVSLWRKVGPPCRAPERPWRKSPAAG